MSKILEMPKSKAQLWSDVFRGRKMNRIDEFADAFQRWMAEWEANRKSQVSCGAGASAGKASGNVRVEGLGAGTVVPDNRANTAVNHAQSSGSESQQNCAGLGAGWGIQPAGIQPSGYVGEDGGFIPEREELCD